MCTFPITQLVTHASEVPVPGSYNVVMCDIYLPSVPGVQCSLVQVTKCWDWYCDVGAGGTEGVAC